MTSFLLKPPPSQTYKLMNVKIHSDNSVYSSSMNSSILYLFRRQVSLVCTWLKLHNDLFKFQVSVDDEW